MVQVGDRAPDFAAETQHSTAVRLSDYKGRRVALYFYPKDNTPGCTKQACSLRDHAAILEAQGIAVLGVSGDSVASHQRFAAEHHLPFPLLADTDKKIMTAYGVWGEKKMYGRTFMGVKRTTFLINEDGVIHHIIRRPKVAVHAEEVLKKFGA